MNPISAGEYHGLRVGSAVLSIVAGCILIGVSRECDADAIGGIFLGAGGLGLLISIFPFVKAWLNINHILPSFGNFRVHPAPANPAPEQPTETLRREATQCQLNLERSKSRMGTFVEAGPMTETSPDEGCNPVIQLRCSGDRCSFRFLTPQFSHWDVFRHARRLIQAETEAVTL